MPKKDRRINIQILCPPPPEEYLQSGDKQDLIYIIINIELLISIRVINKYLGLDKNEICLYS